MNPARVRTAPISSSPVWWLGFKGLPWPLVVNATMPFTKPGAIKGFLSIVIHKFGPPEIMNTDQGSQFRSFVWTDRLRRSGVRISMDRKGRFLDKIFTERLRRTMKYECVYLYPL